jgi:hypothetical protein
MVRVVFIIALKMTVIIWARREGGRGTCFNGESREDQALPPLIEGRKGFKGRRRDEILWRYPRS